MSSAGLFRPTGLRSAPADGSFSGTSGCMKMETGVKRERRWAATLAPLFLCCGRELFNCPRCFFQGDYLARLFDISASAPITKWWRRYEGRGGRAKHLKVFSVNYGGNFERLKGVLINNEGSERTECHFKRTPNECGLDRLTFPPPSR